MLKAALWFFILALVSIILGLTGIAGLSLEIGKLLLFVFLALSIISFVINSFSTRRGPPTPPVG